MISVTSFEPFKLFIKSVLCWISMAIGTLAYVFHDALYPSMPSAIIPAIRIMESPIGLSTNIINNNSTIAHAPYPKYHGYQQYV